MVSILVVADTRVGGVGSGGLVGVGETVNSNPPDLGRPLFTIAPKEMVVPIGVSAVTVNVAVIVVLLKISV